MFCIVKCATFCSVETPHERLRYLRVKAGYVDASDFARAHGIVEVTYRKHETGENGIRGPVAERYAKILGVPAAWILFGDQDGDDPTPTAAAPRTYDEFAFLPVFDSRASAGFGCINDEAPEPIHFNAYRLDWLHRVTSASSEMLAVIRVSGDSNWPTLHDGDHVLIDRTITRYSRDGLYVIRYNHDDEVMVKRLSRDPRSRLLSVKSDNSDYPTFDGVKDDDISVIGRVLWLGRNVG